ncbi:MAG: hypothetical protein V3W26_01205 [Thermodesulfobacteriota bacterium]
MTPAQAPAPDVKLYIFNSTNTLADWYFNRAALYRRCNLTEKYTPVTDDEEARDTQEKM